MRPTKKLVLIACLPLLSSLVGDKAIADEPTFADVNVILTKYCAGCYNANDVNGEFALDTFSSLVKGGEHGNALTPGIAASSRMIQQMRGKLEPKMPPEARQEKHPSEEK